MSMRDRTRARVPVSVVPPLAGKVGGIRFEYVSNKVQNCHDYPSL